MSAFDIHVQTVSSKVKAVISVLYEISSLILKKGGGGWGRTFSIFGQR